MSPADRDFSSGSEDADELVADLLQQFSSVDDGKAETAIPTSQLTLNKKASTRAITAPSLSPSSHSAEAVTPSRATSAPKRPQTFVIEVPPLPENADQYEFLPGHDMVRTIWDQKRVGRTTRYLVELQSLDKEWLRESYLTTLENGREALASFKKNGPPKSKKTTRYSSTAKSETDDHGESAVSESLDSSDDELIVASTTKRRRGRQLGRPRGPGRPRRRNTSDEDDDNDEDDSDAPPVRRSTRMINRPEVTRSVFWSNDEMSSDDILSARTSNRRRSGRRAARRTSKRMRDQQLEDSDSRLRRRGVRSSNRIVTARSNRNGFKERLEDDISEVEDTRTEKRALGAKEKFHRLHADDPFRLRHRQVCDSCSIHGDDREKGPLVFCQSCANAYHASCLGPRSQREHLVTKVDWDQFVLQCRRCIGTAQKKDALAPHLGHCASCNEENPPSKPFRKRLTPGQEQQQREQNGGLDPITEVDQSLLNNPDHVMFRCVNCQRSFHLEHLPAKSDADANDAESVEPDSDIASVRFKEYSRRWRCHTCIAAPGEIEGLVGWRPVDADAYIPGYTVDAMKETEKEYLVKWKRKSYYRATWMDGSWVWGVVSPLTRKAFFKSPQGLKPQMTSEDAIPEDFLRIDIVFDVKYSNIVSTHSKEIDLARVKDVKEAYVKYKGLTYEDAVWETVPSPNETERWDDFKAAYEDWVQKDYVRVPKASSLKQHLATVREQDFQSTLVKKAQPNCLTGGKIMDYQLDGLNWLYYKWYQQQNAILADEMGLGKTIQIVSFLSTLIEDHRCWPFLVVVPNSTCPNWRREIKKWAPSLRVVTFYGSSVARKLAHEYEMFPKNYRDLRAHIVVTSYESMVEDKTRKILAGVPWAGLVVDEGQRLKNDTNLLYGALSSIHFPFKVLLTGTPLQNNIRELFNLIQFCDPTRSAQDLEERYETLTKENVPELHDMIRPFFLRRTKAQVLTFLPPMAQIIIPVSMSVVQKKLYKSILAKNSKLIKSIFQNNQDSNSKQNERHSLSNILMQLRKCLCHPFVYSKQIEERTSNATLAHRNLVEASGKLQLLELLLPKLKERGHRVLLFSQFLDNLDVVEDFLDGLGLLYSRLDGSMGAHEKQKRIDEYNEPNSKLFAFLLSTRSGGVGINLATADTVIIMDPDFNPHQDIQALSRAHRIGQKKKVLVFQLMTRESAEEKIMQIGKKKMALDHVLIEKMDADEDDSVDLESILRHGAEALFEDDNTGDVHYDAESVEKLLDRSQAENTKTGNDESAESQFGFARVWANDHAALEDRLGDSDASTPVNNTLWEKILAERQKAADEEALANAQTLGRGKRKRTTVDYSSKDNKDEQDSPGGSSKRARLEAGSDAEFNAKAVSEESDGGDSVFESLPVKKVKARPFKRIDPSKAIHVDPSNDFIDRSLPCIACNQMHPVGYCPLKLAGVEHCGLCGLAHLGHQRVCPHLNSEEQVSAMLQSLRQSTEPKFLVDAARQYLYGVKADLKKKKAEKNKAEFMSRPASSQHSVQFQPPSVPYPPRPVYPLPSGISGPAPHHGQGPYRPHPLSSSINSINSMNSMNSYQNPYPASSLGPSMSVPSLSGPSTSGPPSMPPHVPTTTATMSNSHPHYAPPQA